MDPVINSLVTMAVSFLMGKAKNNFPLLLKLPFLQGAVFSILEKILGMSVEFLYKTAKGFQITLDNQKDGLKLEAFAARSRIITKNPKSTPEEINDANLRLIELHRSLARAN